VQSTFRFSELWISQMDSAGSQPQLWSALSTVLIYPSSMNCLPMDSPETLYFYSIVLSKILVHNSYKGRLICGKYGDQMGPLCTIEFCSTVFKDPRYSGNTVSMHKCWLLKKIIFHDIHVLKKEKTSRVCISKKSTICSQ